MKRFFLAAFFLISITSAFAEDKVNVCQDDALKFCKSYTSVHDLPKCLREHKKNLSPACKEVLEKSHKSAQEKYSSCKEDLNKLCKTASKKLKCLQDNHAKLSASCKSKI